MSCKHCGTKVEASAALAVNVQVGRERRALLFCTPWCVFSAGIERGKKLLEQERRARHLKRKGGR